MPDEPACPSCGTAYRAHLGLIGTCEALREAQAELERLRTNETAREGVLRRREDAPRKVEQERDEARTTLFSLACSDHGAARPRGLYCSTCGRPMVRAAGDEDRPYREVVDDLENWRSALRAFMPTDEPDELDRSDPDACMRWLARNRSEVADKWQKAERERNEACAEAARLRTALEWLPDEEALSTQRTMEGVLHRWGPGSLWAIYTEDGDIDGYVRAETEAGAIEAAKALGCSGDFIVASAEEDEPGRAEYAAGDIAFLLATMARAVALLAELGDCDPTPASRHHCLRHNTGRPPCPVGEARKVLGEHIPDEVTP